MSKSGKFKGVDPFTALNILSLFAGAITLGVGVGIWSLWPALVGLGLSAIYLLVWVWKYKPYTSPLLIHFGAQLIVVFITAGFCRVVT